MNDDGPIPMLRMKKLDFCIVKFATVAGVGFSRIRLSPVRDSYSNGFTNIVKWNILLICKVSKFF